MCQEARKNLLAHYHIILERQIICRIILHGLCLLRLLRLTGNRLLLLPHRWLSGSRNSRTRIGSFRRQHFHIIDINLGDIAHSSRLVTVRTCSDLSFQVQFVTFVHILIHNLRQTVGCNDIMPLCSFGNLGSISQRISTIRCSQWESCYCRTCIEVFLPADLVLRFPTISLYLLTYLYQVYDS